jgi:hypothetical protein
LRILVSFSLFSPLVSSALSETGGEISGSFAASGPTGDDSSDAVTGRGASTGDAMNSIGQI